MKFWEFFNATRRLLQRLTHSVARLEIKLRFRMLMRDWGALLSNSEREVALAAIERM